MKKQLTIGRIVSYLFCLSLVCMVVFGVSYARYTTSVSGNASAWTAAVAMDGKITTTQVDVSGMQPGDKKEISFQVINFSNDKVSEVAQNYAITVKTAGNLPFTFTLEPVSPGTADINSKAGWAGDMKETGDVWKTEISGFLPAAEQTTHSYKLYIEWPTKANEPKYADEINYHFVNGTNNETDSSNQMINMSTGASLYILPAIAETVKRGYVTRHQADHILKCVLEAAGKAMFGERYAIKACRDWLGVPSSFGEDARVMGALIEMLLQSLVCEYDVESFNKDEVVLIIERSGLEITATKDMPEIHLWMWQGMVKTLVNAQWSLWEEKSPERKMRIKIAKKIDKFM